VLNLGISFYNILLRRVPMKKPVLFMIIILLTSCSPGKDNKIKNGDIIFHESRSSQGRELELATGSKYTHMGIIFIKNGKKYVYEAVQPVTITPLDRWVNRGRGGHYVIKRLKTVSYKHLRAHET